MMRLAPQVGSALLATLFGVIVGYSTPAQAQVAPIAREGRPFVTPLGPFSLPYEVLIDKFGESMPDAYFPPMQALPGTNGPDPVLLAQNRREFAAALRRHGLFEKAARVDILAKIGDPLDAPPSVASTEELDLEAVGPNGLASCDDSDSVLCNYSSYWLRVMGDTECQGACQCSMNWVAWMWPDVCFGDGAEGWSDIDQAWNCFGTLRVGSTTKAAGTDSWHQGNGTYVEANDDSAGSGSHPVVLTGSGTTCWFFCHWNGSCDSCCS